MNDINNKALTQFSKLLQGSYTIDELETLHHITHLGAICLAIHKLQDTCEEKPDDEVIEALSFAMLLMVAPAAEDYFRQMKEKD